MNIAESYWDIAVIPEKLTDTVRDRDMHLEVIGILVLFKAHCYLRWSKGSDDL